MTRQAQPKSKGMLFKGDMVRALLNTKPGVWPAEPIDPAKPFKWQTRRLLKIQPQSEHEIRYADMDTPEWEPPYPEGSIVFVKETFYNSSHESKRCPIMFRADCSVDDELERDWKWTPSVFMWREESRMGLEIMRVRVERICDISREDAIAEGVDWKQCPTTQSVESIVRGTGVHKVDYVGGYKRLIESINGPHAWDKWAFVYDLKRIK